MHSEQTTEIRLCKEFKLSPQLSKLLRLLIYMELVTPAVVHQNVSRVSQINQMVHRLRRSLPGDVPIHNVHGVGWYLDEEAKAVLRAACSGSGDGKKQGPQDRYDGEPPGVDALHTRRSA